MSLRRAVTPSLRVMSVLVGSSLLTANLPALRAATPTNNPSAAPFLLPGATRVGTLAGRAAMVERNEEQVLITALKVADYQVTDNLPVYAIPGGVLIPLGEFCRLLQLAIDVNPMEGQAKGWFIEKNRTFSFDALTGTATVQGVKQVINPQRFEVQTQDIFVDVSLLEAWFPLTVKADLRGSVLQVVPKEKLPIQATWERNAAAYRDLGKYGVSAVEEERKRYIPIENLYRLAEIPAIDQTLRVGTTSYGDRHLLVQSTTLTSGDLLGLEHQAYLNLTNQPGAHRDFRMVFGRKDPAGTLLGPLRATQFQLGDVQSQGADLVLSSAMGRGFSVTNAPLLLDHRFDRRSFRGNLAPGWHVELYHNTALLGMQAVRPDGTYEFLDVPMYFGPNEYKLVFYGPQGERREEIYRSDVNPMQVPRGQFRYRVYGQDPSYGGRRGLAEAEYGLAPNLGVGLAAMSLDLANGRGDTERHTYSVVNLRSYANHLATQYTVARMDNGKLAQQVLMQTGIGFSSLSLRHSEYQEGYRSETLNQVGLSGALRRSSDLSVYLHGGSLGVLNALSTSFGARRDVYAQGATYHTFYHRLSASWHGFSFSNDVSWSRAQRTNPAQFLYTQPTRGSFGVSRYVRGIGLHGAVGYALSRKREITDYTASADYHLPDQAYLSLQATRLKQSGQTTLGMAYMRQIQKALSLGADVSYTQRIGWRANLTLRTSFLREPRQGKWSASALSSQNQGTLSAVAYVDSNNNGVRDAGEPVKSGVGFTVNGFQRPARTNDQGIAFIPDVQAGNYAYIRVDNASLEDPLWRSNHPGFRFVSRSGHAAQVELPVLALGEMDGTVYTETKGKKASVAGMLVELLDASGKVVRQVRSAFDGYFIFQDIAPGTYTLRINPEDAAKRYAVPGPTRTLVFQPSGSLLDAQDLSVTLLPKPKGLQEIPEVPEEAGQGGGGLDIKESARFSGATVPSSHKPNGKKGNGMPSLTTLEPLPSAADQLLKSRGSLLNLAAGDAKFSRP